MSSFIEELLSSVKEECIDNNALLKIAIHKIVCDAINNINMNDYIQTWELREIQIRKRIETELYRWLPEK